MIETRGPMLKLNDEVEEFLRFLAQGARSHTSEDTQRFFHSVLFRAFSFGYDLGCACGCTNGDKK